MRTIAEAATGTAIAVAVPRSSARMPLIAEDTDWPTMIADPAIDITVADRPERGPFGREAEQRHKARPDGRAHEQQCDDDDRQGFRRREERAIRDHDRCEAQQPGPQGERCGEGRHRDRQHRRADAHDAVDESGFLRAADVIGQRGQCRQCRSEHHADAEDAEDDDEDTAVNMSFAGARSPRRLDPPVARARPVGCRAKAETKTRSSRSPR
jgi:hypothetical protein